MRALCILAIFAFVKCAMAKAPVEIEFWHSMTGAKSRLLKQLAEDFNAHNPDVHVRVEFAGSYEEGLNKLRTALLGGRGPSVIQITDIGQKVMIDSGRALALEDLSAKDPEFPQLLPQIRRYYEVDGKLRSLPFATSNPVLYYNRDAFEKAGITKPPRTYSELEEVAARLTDRAARITGLTWPLHSWFFEEFLARQGVELIGPDNGRGSQKPVTANYTSPEALAFIDLWARMVRAGTFANVGRGWDPAEQNFLAGRTRMLITSTSDVFEVEKQASFHLGTAPIPTADHMSAEAANRGGTIVGGNSLWIMKDRPEAETAAAYRFVKYMASFDVQKIWHTSTGYFPIRADVIDSLKREGFYDRYPAAWTAIEQLRESPDSMAARGALMGVFPEAREHVANAVEEVLSGRLTTSAAMAKAKRKTELSLKRYNLAR